MPDQAERVWKLFSEAFGVSASAKTLQGDCRTRDA
jgi:hypothetical protein